MEKIKSILRVYLDLILKENINSLYENKTGLVGYKCLYETEGAKYIDKIVNIDAETVLLECNKIIKWENIKIIDDRENIQNLFEYLLNGDLVETEIYNMLSESMSFSGMSKYKSILEEIKTELTGEEALLYNLKDLYKKVLTVDRNGLYIKPLECILKIINLSSNKARMEAIINELQVYKWIPYINIFIEGLLNGETNLTINNYIADVQKVYGVADFTQDGQLVYMSNRWFLFKNNSIETVNLEDVVYDATKLMFLNNLANVINNSIIDDGYIHFFITDEIKISVSISNRNVYINGDKIDDENTIYNLFSTGQIPFEKRVFYKIIEMCLDNLNYFVHIDVAIKILNKIHNRAIYIINYMDRVYEYDVHISDSTFYEISDITKLINMIRDDFDYDLSDFLRDKLSDELLKRKELLDSEKTIKIEIDKTKKIIDKLKDDKINADEIDKIKINENLEKFYIKKLILERKLKNL